MCPDKYVCGAFGLCFDSKSSYTYSDNSSSSSSNAHNVVVFGADSSKSNHNGNKLPENVLILGKGLIQKINGQTVYADYSLPNNSTQTDKKVCLSLHYDGPISRIFVNGKRQVKFTAKDSQITPYKMCLGNISADFSVENAQKTGLHGNIYDFSFECGVFSDFEIHDLHAYLMKKNDIV